MADDKSISDDGIFDESDGEGKKKHRLRKQSKDEASEESQEDNIF